MRETRSVQHMSGTREILIVLQNVESVLKINPNHEEAQRLLKRANQRAKQQAEKLLASGIRLRNNRAEFFKKRVRSYLRDVIKLDPKGPLGQKARQYLKAR